MGLDIRTKNDYARFNWQGSANFIRWCNEHLELEPFPAWDCGNGSQVKITGKNKKYAEQWCKALEDYCVKIGDNDILTEGQGERIGDVVYRTYDMCYHELKEKYKFVEDDVSLLDYKKELKEWEYIQAIKWYFVLKDAIDCGFIFYG
jgi:hypothetical protein